jgi:Ca-activated chloride channel family protein
VAIVTYDGKPDILLPSQTVEDCTMIRQAIGSIASGGSTNLYGGWYTGAESVAPHATPFVTSRVILLSDGRANVGVTDLATILFHCRKLASAGVTTSTYGLGEHFNEELMLGMAEHGGGRPYYGKTAEDLMDPFSEELDLLTALCARQPTLWVTTASAISVKMRNKYLEVSPGVWQLPDLAFGGEAWALVRLKVPKELAASGDGAPIELAGVQISYNRLDGELVELPPATLTLPVLPPAAFQAVSKDDLVVRRLREVEAANLQDRARLAARCGDWHVVRRILDKARRRAVDNPWLGDVVAVLTRLAEEGNEARFAKEAAYAQDRIRRRLAARDESPDASMPIPRYLRRKAEQGRRAPDAP